MRIKNLILITAVLLFAVDAAYTQDKRTLETKIADLLAQFPANDLQYTDKLMTDMLALGEEGLKSICNRIIPAGSGDDTKARFAAESFSRYLSQKGMERDRIMWEKICISYAVEQKNPGVKDFFIKQLQQIGGELTPDALKIFLNDSENCFPAVAAINAAGGAKAEQVFAESLRNPDLPCAASVMNALAGMKSSMAVNEYIKWASVQNVNTKAAAYNALAQSGSPLAYPVLLKAAKSYSFRWERTGSTAALLNYAERVGRDGDVKTLDKICKLVIKKCNDKLTFQNKTAALKIYSDFHGIEAMAELIKAAAHPDQKFRSAAINMSLGIKQDEVVQKWIDYYPKATIAAKADIISMLRVRGDKRALPLINEAISNQDQTVRLASYQALAAISGRDAAPVLVSSLMKYDMPADQEAIVAAFKNISGNREIALLKPVIKDGSSAAKKSAIELIAWNGSNEYFKDILPLASSNDGQVASAASKALSGLAGVNDQEALTGLLLRSENPAYIADIQNALSVAAALNSDPRKRSAAILKAMSTEKDKIKLIPVLAKTGGREALAAVLKEFESGSPEIKEVCFKALISWSDYSASSALYEICASKNKTYEAPAFDGYVRQVRGAPITDEQKLLLYRKIMPFAASAERKNRLLTEIGRLKTYQALFFVSGYLNDPETSAAAAKSAMYIALPSVTEKTGMYGKNVRDILVKAMVELRGQESEYDREMMKKYLDNMVPDEGFVSMFNGKDLSGWQGLVENPVARSKMKPSELAAKQAEADSKVPGNWSVKDGAIWFNGRGNNLCSVKEYGDFEMLVDWVISKEGDSGIYLRGSPQVQIWDTSRVQAGAQVGSGGLYNNQKNPSKPLKVADNQVGEWNTFRIIMIGEVVSVWLNGELVVDNVVMENYWERKIPIFPKGAIELQAHGTDLAFRDIYVREINEKEYNLTPEEKTEGFIALFNGRNLEGWTGNKDSYVVEDGMIVIKPEQGSGGNLYTEKEYADFIFRFEFQLTPAANNGLGIRTPLTGDAAYAGMELQILDNTAPVYANLQPYQYHGSVYGVIPAKREFLKPVGEWNYQEVYIRGTQIRITLNGTVIVDGDIAGPRDKGTMDNREHPGLKNKSGHIGFLGHGSVVKFRNIRIRDISTK